MLGENALISLNRRRLITHSACTLAALASAKIAALAQASHEVGLRDHFRQDFHIGTAISHKLMQEFAPVYRELILREFNAVTLENDMKWSLIHPQRDTWQWQVPDKFVAFAHQHNLYAVGHVLVWHSQVPEWVFKDESGKVLSRDALLARMQHHIHTVVSRYKGKLDAWDVVNEAIDEGDGWRKSHWYNIIGADFVDRAFHYAHDTDPSAHLIYNDYNMHLPAKREFVVEMVKGLQKRGVPIHGIGMQGHVGLTYPDIKEFEQSIQAYAALGMRVHITEMDVDVLPVAWEHTGAEISDNFAYADELNPYTNALPLSTQRQLTDRYVEFFKLFLKYRDDIERVTLWGTADAESWKNNFPVRGRTNYPLLFDRDYRKKSAYFGIADLKSKNGK